MCARERGDGAARLVRAAHLLGRDLLAPLELQARSDAGAGAGEDAAAGHHVHRLRVLLATMASWLEGHDGRWLDELRRAREKLPRTTTYDAIAAQHERDLND